jgi:type IX secretion system PorP/SprF family membrane protein
MKKIIILTLLWCSLGTLSFAQQDPMFTQYMFNPLPYNPAIAGTTEAFDILLLHRQQWVGINGAPMSQHLSLHSPIKIGKQNQNAALGGVIGHDQIGLSRTFTANAAFSYKLQLSNPRQKSKAVFLNIGLSGGVSYWYADFNKLELDNTNDPSFQNLQPSRWLPNFGAGLYLHSKMWYVGLSAPKLWTNNMRERAPGESGAGPLAQEYRHYYFTVGGAIKLSENLAIRPSLLIKNVGLFVAQNATNSVGAPTEFNVDLGFLIMKRFWIGASFRSAVEAFVGQTSSYDSVDFWMGMRLKSGIRFGLAYDYHLTSLQGPSVGSYEVMLGYDLNKSTNIEDGGNVVDPRYLNF